MGRHDGHDVVSVSAGDFDQTVDGQRVTAGAGSSAFASPGTAHAYQNFKDEPAHVLVMVTPAGLDRFFGMELLGPPLS